METKIAIVLPFERKGGLEKMATLLANKLVIHGYDVSFIMTKCDEELYPLDRRIHTLVLPHDIKTGRIQRIIGKFSSLRAFVKSNRIETIISFGHFGTFFAVPATIGMKIKHIATVRTDPAREPNTRLLRLVRDILYCLSDYIVFQTEQARDYFKKRIREKGIVIPNPIPNSLPFPTGNPRNRDIVNFCRLDKQKNLPLLISAFGEFKKTHPDYRLLIYGKGDIKDELEAQIIQEGLANSAYIRDFRPDIHGTIIDSAMFVSTSDYEGISNSMLEAMAIGLPVVCTDCPVGGAKMMIDNEVNGLLIPVNNKEAVVVAMSDLADHPDKAKILGDKAIKVRENYSEEQIFNKWIEVINACE